MSKRHENDQASDRVHVRDHAFSCPDCGRILTTQNGPAAHRKLQHHKVWTRAHVRDCCYSDCQGNYWTRPRARHHLRVCQENLERLGVTSMSAHTSTQLDEEELELRRSAAGKGRNICYADNDNDNDNDTLRKVPHRSNEGLGSLGRTKDHEHGGRSSENQPKPLFFYHAGQNNYSY